MTALVPQVIDFPAALPLLGRAQAGDQDAFAELIERHEAMVYSLAWNFFGDRGRAEEITRRCIDQTRRARMKVVSLDDAAEVQAHDRPADPLLDKRLRELIGELPEMQRAVVTLRYQEDLDPSEICRIVGVPVNTVKSHLHRALQSLRRKLEKHP
jgi:RNA polymerase sigma-70 factor (ECF subfamily)